MELDKYKCDAKKKLTLMMNEDRIRSCERGGQEPIGRLLEQLREWRSTNGALRCNGAGILPFSEPMSTQFSFSPQEMTMRVDLRGFKDSMLNVEIEERQVSLQMVKEARLSQLGSTGLSVDSTSKIYHLPYPVVPPLSSTCLQNGILTITLPWQLQYRPPIYKCTNTGILKNACV